MRKLNPIERSQYIDKQYKEYLKSSFEFGKSDLQKLFVEQLEEEKLFKGPYVDMSFPFARGSNIESLINDGVVCKSFYNLNDVNFTRPLYSHQEEAIRLINSGRSAVITTGTGSGKTESFLYPILNDLLFDIEKGNDEIGVRAIFLYPMNALVNDQIDRVRKMLCNCPQITFGFFTGDTPETVNEKYRARLSEENNTEIPDNELLSRSEIRENPPHLLFTNYSMLEYLLIRPNDYAIFEPSRLSNWKYVVLDEAHSYNGALGIELSVLLRRLTGLATRRPQFILTSATLGTQGESEKDIVKFAQNLTSAEFSKEDIIFSKRIQLVDRTQYQIAGEDYSLLKQKLDNLDDISLIVSKYTSSSSDDVHSMLYDLLSKDANVFKLSSLLSEGSRDFSDIYENMSATVSQEQLIDLIDIINVAEKNGVGLFEMKYHSFVRPLSGAFVTLGIEPKLTLTKTAEINGLKAFELGNCRYCNTPYIIGKIQRRNNNGLCYLLQNKEVDLYENYGNEEFVRLDFFLLDGYINDDAEYEEDSVEPYDVCSKCGELHSALNLNTSKCDCDEKFRFRVFKVIQKQEDETESIYNNIKECPCCGHRGQSGVVKALNIGKDEGTALIAQMLYEAIDEGEQEASKTKKITLGAKKDNNKLEVERKVKQFLAFSDSRQQASFFAVFFEDNHNRMLRKRLIWEEIVAQNYGDITINELASYLTESIKKQNLFANGMNAQKNAWAAILIDLLKVDGSYDGEGLGLYYFDIDISEIMEAFDDFDQSEIKEHFGDYGLQKDELYTLIQIVFSLFKTTPAVNYSKSTLTQEERRDLLDYRRFSNYVTLNAPKKQKNDTERFNNIRSLLPVSGRSNMVVRYVMKAFECSEDTAKKTIETLFSLLVQVNELPGADKMLFKHEKKEAYQIDASRYILKNYKNNQYYICDKCKRLTPYNIRGACVQDDCLGTLKQADPDMVLANNYYRKQYIHKKIERIVAKEHTAQLERKTAKEYQNDFKRKSINILSCSTTFEMGIDIGGLETVFMRNVPPTPANYVQRAGRAGRRKDSAAYILTYCGTGSHDFTYFSEPEKMISGVINPPVFNIMNKKIIVRHLMATSLGFFFRNHPEYYKSVDELAISGGGVDAFKEYIRSHPDDLNAYINNKILPEKRYADYWDFNWLDDIGDSDEKLTNFVESINEMLEEFSKAKEKALLEEKYDDVKYYDGQISKLKNADVISSLSKYCVIPKYGFPVDVVELKIYEDGHALNKYDLSRDLSIAISEYAPDSEVIVDGNKYTSKYITLGKTNAFQRNYYLKCQTCKKLNLFLSVPDKANCKFCGKPISESSLNYYIEPTKGFKTGETKESTRLKPKRSYAGEVSYVGNGKIDEKRLILGNALGIETSSNDQLLVMNKSGFYMCPTCGFGKIVKSGLTPPQTIFKHNNFKQFSCNNDKLDYLHIGHKFQTDVARLIIPELSSLDEVSYPRALSFLYALLEGVSIALGIERNDIDGVLELNLELQSYDILLYDSVPGGAGHVKRLLSKDAVVVSLSSALEKVLKNCCDENTSCYNCLRNYYNQSYHSKLQRRLAIDVINKLLFDLEGVDEFYQNEKWIISTINTSENKTKKIILSSDGRNPGNETAYDIWTELLDDCTYEYEEDILKQLLEKSPEYIDRPYYDKTAKIEESGEEFSANLIWVERKVILFLSDSYDDYLIAKKTGWNVYCTKDGFDVDELLRKVGA